MLRLADVGMMRAQSRSRRHRLFAQALQEGFLLGGGLFWPGRRQEGGKSKRIGCVGSSHIFFSSKKILSGPNRPKHAAFIISALIKKEKKKSKRGDWIERKL